MDGVTRLRLSMGDEGSIQTGSSNPVSERSKESTSADGFAVEDLAGVEGYGSYAEFVADTQKPLYKGGVYNAREAEAFRELCAKRLAKMNVNEESRAADFAPANTAEAITQLDPSIIPAVAQVAANDGPFVTREQRANAYADPRYKVSEDYRGWVAARDALTEEF